MGEQVYVELPIRAPLERVWALTQQLENHARWDLRFSSITARGTGTPQRFRYEFRLPFHTIRGTGISLGSRTGSGGQATSVLKFTTSDPLSPIGPGAGYWRYIPDGAGIRFITGYHYSPGWGTIGQRLDRPLIRPALGWATAWSFDRLRLWAEDGLSPESTRNAWLLDAGARTAAAAAAVVLLCRGKAVCRGKAPTARAVTGALVCLTAAWLMPRHRRIPQARRCLRRPPDRQASQAPSSLASLAEPA